MKLTHNEKVLIYSALHLCSENGLVAGSNKEKVRDIKRKFKEEIDKEEDGSIAGE